MAATWDQRAIDNTISMYRRMSDDPDTMKTVLDAVLKCGFPVNAWAQTGLTLLHEAVSNDDLEFVSTLLAAGADPTIRPRKFGYSLGHFVKSVAMAELTDAHRFANCPDNDHGELPIYMAIHMDHAELVAYWLRYIDTDYLVMYTFRWGFTVTGFAQHLVKTLGGAKYNEVAGLIEAEIARRRRWSPLRAAWLQAVCTFL